QGIENPRVGGSIPPPGTIFEKASLREAFFVSVPHHHRLPKPVALRYRECSTHNLAMRRATTLASTTLASGFIRLRQHPHRP
ncbi:hypothetical protein, partial [Alcanivorax profundi]|uniref:hypothetical protein n=1 Tax=Alcanivorax profundi TaxID=2338368 RepID=UPI0032B249B0